MGARRSSSSKMRRIMTKPKPNWRGCHSLRPPSTRSRRTRGMGRTSRTRVVASWYPPRDCTFFSIRIRVRMRTCHYSRDRLRRSLNRNLRDRGGEVAAATRGGRTPRDRTGRFRRSRPRETSRNRAWWIVLGTLRMCSSSKRRKWPIAKRRSTVSTCSEKAPGKTTRAWTLMKERCQITAILTKIRFFSARGRLLAK